MLAFFGGVANFFGSVITGLLTITVMNAVFSHATNLLFGWKKYPSICKGLCAIFNIILFLLACSNMIFKYMVWPTGVVAGAIALFAVVYGDLWLDNPELLVNFYEGDSGQEKTTDNFKIPCCEAVKAATESWNPVFEELRNVYVYGAAQPANEIFNHKLICETAEIVKSTDARLCQLRDALLLSESEHKRLPEDGIRLHEEACTKFCATCDDIRSFGEEVWPRMRIAAKQFNLVKDAEQRDLVLLQTVQAYLDRWNTEIDFVSQLSVQMAEALLKHEKQNCENENAVNEIVCELDHCRNLLLHIRRGLKDAPLREDIAVLTKVFCRIEPKEWNKEILSYSVMYLELLNKSVNEYQTSPSDAMRDSIKNGLELLKMMWVDMLRKVEDRGLAELRAELKVAEKLAHMRGYVPGELEVRGDI